MSFAAAPVVFLPLLVPRGRIATILGARLLALNDGRALLLGAWLLGLNDGRALLLGARLLGSSDVRTLIGPDISRSRGGALLGSLVAGSVGGYDPASAKFTGSARGSDGRPSVIR
jgi:hypothetical protein